MARWSCLNVRFLQTKQGDWLRDIDRYWGTSSPYQSLTSETLQYLTLEQSIADLTHFAKTVDLPFDEDHSSNADNAVRISAGIKGHLLKLAAVGVDGRLIQRRIGCLDRIHLARYILGLPRCQRACRGYLRLCKRPDQFSILF